jgi:hypothetical protein
MQSAKDSFYMALRQRLAAVSPARTTTLDGRQQPAILVSENESRPGAALPTDCFCLSFGEVRVAPGFERAPDPLMACECTIEYSTHGAAANRSDRGRALGALDADLLRICTPPSTQKIDYTQQPPCALAGNIFWLRPQYQAVEEDGVSLRRAATLMLYFAPEVIA